MMSSNCAMPPLFAYAGDNFDQDFDIGLLSEYLFDGNIPAQQSKQSQNSTEEQYYGNGNSDYSLKFDNDDEFNFENDDEDGLSIDDEIDDSKRRRTSSNGADGDENNHDNIGRRRERNRVLARKTRLRKKYFFESLQRQVTQLASENEMLKKLVKQKLEIPDGNSPEFFASSVVQATAALEKADQGLLAAIQAAKRSFCLTDPTLPDNPIVFASKGFLDLTGYSLDEVLGRNCRFLQGQGTDPTQLEILKKGIINGEDVSVCLVNYKADGTSFYNQLFVAALRDSNDKIINYVGVQIEVPHNPSESSNSSGIMNSTSVHSSIRNGMAANNSTVTCGESEGLTEGDSHSKDEKSVISKKVAQSMSRSKANVANKTANGASNSSTGRKDKRSSVKVQKEQASLLPPKNIPVSAELNGTATVTKLSKATGVKRGSYNVKSKQINNAKNSIDDTHTTTATGIKGNNPAIFLNQTQPIPIVNAIKKSNNKKHQNDLQSQQQLKQQQLERQQLQQLQQKQQIMNDSNMNNSFITNSQNNNGIELVYNSEEFEFYNLQQV